MGQAVGTATMTRDRSAENFAEEKFRLAVEACPSGMVMTDSTGVIVLVNSATELLFGYRRDELVGQRMEILVPERLRGEHLKQRAVFALHPQARRVQPNRELFGRRHDATEFPVEVWLNPIHAGDDLFVLSVIVDISERKRVDSAQGRVRLDGAVTSCGHRSTRLPVRSGCCSAARPESCRKPRCGFCAIAQTNSKRLVRLLNDILDIEKIESGQVSFNFKRIDVRALIEQVIEANRAYADGFGIRVRLDPASQGGEVLADPDRLAQVVTNLLSNAIKFSPRDGEVAVATEQRGDRVRISVRDHGDGIPAEFKPRLFEKFAQADATDARQKGGTGLGLSIVREIVTRLGGMVGFEDADGGGTVLCRAARLGANRRPRNRCRAQRGHRAHPASARTMPTRRWRCGTVCDRSVSRPTSRMIRPTPSSGRAATLTRPSWSISSCRMRPA